MKWNELPTGSILKYSLSFDYYRGCRNFNTNLLVGFITTDDIITFVEFFPRKNLLDASIVSVIFRGVKCWLEVIGNVESYFEVIV